LSDNNYLVGYGATLADLSVAACLLTPLSTVYNKYFASKYPNVTSFLGRMDKKFRLSKLPPALNTLGTTVSQLESEIGLEDFADFERDLKLGNIY